MREPAQHQIELVLPAEPGNQRLYQVAAVNANGCASDLPDEDSDGVPDTQDQCPDTPLGQTVERSGCRANAGEADPDADGVASARDLCPGTAFNAVVNDRGCSANQSSDNPIAARSACDFDFDKVKAIADSNCCKDGPVSTEIESGTLTLECD